MKKIILSISLLLFSCKPEVQNIKVTDAKPSANLSQIKELQRTDNLHSAYLQWVKNINNTKYCSKKKCLKNIAIQEDELWNENNTNITADANCNISIVDKFPDEIIYGDINNDGINDAFIYAEIMPCMLGTWFVNVKMAGHLVIFISKPNGSYHIIDNPEILSDNIEFGRIKKIEKNMIYAEGLGLDTQFGVHHIGYRWNCKFNFTDNQFHLVSKSEREKYNNQQ